MIQYKVKCSRYGLRSDVWHLFFFAVLIFFLKDGDTYNIGEKIFYEIFITYWAVRIVFDILLDDQSPEDFIPQCGCSFCSGFHILK